LNYFYFYVGFKYNNIWRIWILQIFFVIFIIANEFNALNLFNKYYFLVAFAGIAFTVPAQTVSSNATLTIIGDPLPEVPDKSITSVSNPYINTNTPPDKSQQLAAPQHIEPTFDNGFHIRYEINSPQKIDERPTSTGYAYASISGGGASTTEKIKKKHVTTLAERSFNFKKRFNHWAPKRKKKYRPHICGRF
jgi:hypothetical protein